MRLVLRCSIVSVFLSFAACGETDRPPVGDGGAASCTADIDCDDRVHCTIDRCVDGTCRSTPRVCAVGTRCDEARDACVGSVACASDAECDDGDACVMGDRCDPSTRVCAYDGPLDGDGDGEPPVVCGGGDCDDARADVRPGAAEICNGRDDDCNGMTDDAAPTTLCPVAASVCTGGECRCSGGQVACAGESRCIDLETSADHCGGCGNVCVGECVAGVCDDTCGEVGESCCGRYDSLYCVEGECSDGERCTPCGGRAESCCFDRETSEPACRDGGCMSSTGECGLCGELNTECCLGTAQCGAGLVCKDEYRGNFCRACGGEGEDCCDVGSACGAGFVCGGGRCVTEACRTFYDALPTGHAPLCTAETRECVAACAPGDVSCVIECTYADTTAPLETPTASINCTECLNFETAACATDVGCEAQFDDFVCCFVARTSCSPYDSSCPDCELESYSRRSCEGASGCSNLSAPQIARCFPAP